MSFVYVFLGGGLGSMLRYGLSRWIPAGEGLPWATLTANLASCILLGWLYALSLQSDQRMGWLALWMVGFCGGFSTFSTFSLENFKMIQEGRWLMATTYTLVSVVVCLLGLWLGMRWAKVG